MKTLKTVEELIEQGVEVWEKYDIYDALHAVITSDRLSIVEMIEGMKKEVPTYLNKRGHHTNSAHRIIKYNQALIDVQAKLRETLEDHRPDRPLNYERE